MSQEEVRRGEGSKVFVLLSILVFMVGIISAVGMVIAILNYSRETDTPINITVDSPGESHETDSDPSAGGYMYTGGGEASVDTHYDSRIWTIQLDPDIQERIVYIDTKSRQLRGYTVDVVNAVCQIAGKNCQIVDSSHNNCWTDGAAAPGILGKWFDACSGFSISLDRLRAMKFSVSLNPVGKPVFLTLPGNPRNFDPNNLDGKKIGFLEGWWADSNCLFYITDYELTTNQIYKYLIKDDAVEALNNGEVDSILIANQLQSPDDDSLDIVKELTPCLLGGDAMMMRKDSLFKEWWDPAFEKMKNSRTYRGICSDIDDPDVHGKLPGKSAAELCVN